MKNICEKVDANFRLKAFDTLLQILKIHSKNFRAMLMKRKRPQKKVVVKKVEWLESPTDQECQEGKCDKVTFSARLSEKEKRGKWYLMNSVSTKFLFKYLSTKNRTF